MNVSDQIIQVIEHLAQKFGIAINWSSENIMPIVEELCTKYISYEIMTSKMWLIFGAVLFILIALIGVMTLVDISNELKEFGVSVAKNTEDIEKFIFRLCKQA